MTAKRERTTAIIVVVVVIKFYGGMEGEERRMMRKKGSEDTDNCQLDGMDEEGADVVVLFLLLFHTKGKESKLD